MSADGFGILIVDDEPNICTGLRKGLASHGDRLETAESGPEALAKFENGDYQLAIVDVRLPGDFDGLQLVSEIKHRKPETTVIVITAHGTVETAVEAMRNGAYDFITKPVDLSLIRHQVDKALEHHRLLAENRRLREQLADAGEVSEIIGNCAALQDVFRQLRQVADTDATVLIQGESGTGKELIARAIHDMSSRSGAAFVAVNLGALPETLLESELFGHEKGAFTGANRRKPGHFEQAAGGTLFLDEITEMPAKSQVDLLRVLETQQFTRVGGEDVLTADARIVSATNKEMSQLLEDGVFREDLFYRLNVVPIDVPPLRERHEDIPLLVDHFLGHFCTKHGRQQKQVSDGAMQILGNANWPGNVRQLRNMIERLVVTVVDDVIYASDVPPELKSPQPGASVETLAEAVESVEKRTILSALERCDCHREQTAKMLGVSLRTLHYKMSRYGLH